MKPTWRAATRQQRRVLIRTDFTDTDRFFNLLTGPRLLAEIEALLAEHREGLLPPAETLSMLLAHALSADRSCRRAVDAPLDRGVPKVGRAAAASEAGAGAGLGRGSSLWERLVAATGRLVWLRRWRLTARPGRDWKSLPQVGLLRRSPPVGAACSRDAAVGFVPALAVYREAGSRLEIAPTGRGDRTARRVWERLVAAMRRWGSLGGW